MADTIQATIAATADTKTIQRRSTSLIRWLVKTTAGADVNLTGDGARLAINPSVGGVGNFPQVTWDEVNDLVLGNGFVELPVGVTRSMVLPAQTYLGQLFVSEDGFVDDIRLAWAGQIQVLATIW